VSKFIAIDLKYADHAAEPNMPILREPVVFTKVNSCVQGPNAPVMLPKNAVKTDWEVELGVVIGMKKNGKPGPSYLKAGDTIALGIEGLGEQHQKVVAFKKP
jgi:2-keto-4-pentenoate hydratase/2-oxohepta-3-ene-1,7-dioic acid hydratase in catechol pathway